VLKLKKTRKDLKEQSLREGKAIDGMANIIKALIIPIEEHLEKQEKFAEIKAAERMAKRHAERIEKLVPYVADISVYNVDAMTNEAFEELVKNSKKAFEDQKAAEAQAEKDRLAKEEADRIEQERIRKDNERLKKEAEQREIEAAKERKLADDKLEAERKKREKLEQEKRDRENAEIEERKAKEIVEGIEKAKAEEAERQKLLAPDKEKLTAFANIIDNLELPNVSNREAGKLLDETKDFLDRISKNLRNKAREL
jgi:hypothetical protein